MRKVGNVLAITNFQIFKFNKLTLRMFIRIKEEPIKITNIPRQWSSYISIQNIEKE